MQLLPFKILWNEMQQFRCESGFMISVFDALFLSACLQLPLHRTPPPVLNKLTIQTLHVCYWSPSVVCVCVFFPHVVVFAVPPWGEQKCDPRVKGECIILVCCKICCGQVFMTLSRLLGHCVRACQWWGDCMYYESRGGQICFWEGIQLD